MTTVLIWDMGRWDAAIEVGLDHLPRRGDVVCLRRGWPDRGQSVIETNYRVLRVVHCIRQHNDIEPRHRPEADRVAVKEEIVVEVEIV